MFYMTLKSKSNKEQSLRGHLLQLFALQRPVNELLCRFSQVGVLQAVVHPSTFPILTVLEAFIHRVPTQRSKEVYHPQDDFLPLFLKGGLRLCKLGFLLCVCCARGRCVCSVQSTQGGSGGAMHHLNPPILHPTAQILMPLLVAPCIQMFHPVDSD